MHKLHKLLLFFVIALFLFTRLYKIAEIPSSVYWDEASIGYNAFSIVQTGKDEWGDFLPIHFRAFGEFKLPVYIYATALTTSILGLNALTVRLPAIFLSLGVLMVTYLLSKKITKDTSTAILSSLFICISPWFFIISRTGFEANAGLFFYLLGIYLFLRQDKRIFIFLSVISFILSLYSYNAFRIITPLTILFLTALSFKEILLNFRKNLAINLIAILVLFISVIPIYRLIKYDSGISRLQNVGAELNLISISKNYLSHFSPEFLFSGDKNFRFQQKDFGQIYYLDVLLFILGVIYIIGRKQKLMFLPLVLLLLSPIPATITKESPHALRSLSLVPFLVIITAMGVKSLEKYTKGKIIVAAALIIYLILFFNYFYNFINFYPSYSSLEWQYPYKEIYQKYSGEFKSYDSIIVTDEYAQPYIFPLFYLRYSPTAFLNNLKRNNISEWGFSTVSEFDKFKFGKIENLVNENTKNSLVFTTEKERLNNVKEYGVIKSLDGDIAIWVYKL